MIELPETDAVPVLRVDFTDDAVWEAVKRGLLAPDQETEYEPELEFVDRRDLVGIDPGELERQIPRHFPDSYDQPFLVVVDAVAIASPEHPVLLIDLNDEDTSRSFRALPATVAIIEANLSIANMDFGDYAENAGDDGVFRGFS